MQYIHCECVFARGRKEKVSVLNTLQHCKSLVRLLTGKLVKLHPRIQFCWFLFRDDAVQ
jgi:hypothetical protein